MTGVYIVHYYIVYTYGALENEKLASNVLLVILYIIYIISIYNTFLHVSLENKF